ncbi:uncharacterized protein K444DRAFT_697347 [Hyaloscypha bicolor E]|uniref:Uncharacterized protein n=1 Tax=Hyaloscypha bicolor E TaxID=1095630 RepID=A0A2J6SX46_9HELO|nr:uncharacterized protein K444DRAFT_697347 [Hyaloscypha bicolor E]PMD55348.1 hypothetical protein K444DRAFT_697347 [Hyaloscypha bicolor E]
MPERTVAKRTRLEDDAVSLTSIQSEEYDSSQDFNVDDVLAEKTERGRKMFLLSWTGYPEEKSTWAPRKNISAEILESWKEKKKRQEKNIEKPFDIVGFEARLKRLAAEKEDRHRRRKAKRRRLGMQVSESESQERPFACRHPGCRKVFKRRPDLRSHQKAHSKERPFTCRKPGGGKKFKRRPDLRSHQKAHSKERPFTCLHPGCGKPFKRRTDLTQHGRVHSEETPFPCPSCPKKFKSSTALASHRKERPFTCPHDRCGKTYMRFGQLTIHIRTHTRETPFPCPSCPKKFKSSTALASHRISHSKKQRWACPHDGCGKTYMRSGPLTIHIRTHTGETPYPCRYCPKKFKGSGAQKNHERVHSKKRPYACPKIRGQHPAYNCLHCAMAFASSDELKDHDCSGSKDYICFDCGAAFPNSRPLSTHQRRHTRGKSQQKQPTTSGRMRRGEWYRKLEEYLGGWEGRCAFCSMHNLRGTGHSMNGCLEEGIERVRDRCTRLQRELPKKGYQGCHLCYLPLRICDHWEFGGDETGWRESEIEVCQFSGLVNPVIATLLEQNEAGSISTLFDLVDLRDDLNQTSEAIYGWLRRRWGETEASWNIQLFFRISACLNVKKTADTTTTLPNPDNTLSGEDVIDPWLLALEDDNRGIRNQSRRPYAEESSSSRTRGPSHEAVLSSEAQQPVCQQSNHLNTVVRDGKAMVKRRAGKRPAYEPLWDLSGEVPMNHAAREVVRLRTLTAEDEEEDEGGDIRPVKRRKSNMR